MSPSSAGFAPCILLKRVSSRMVRGGAKLRAYRGVALHYAFVGRRFSLEILKALQRDANAPQLMPRGRRDARTSLFTVTFTVHTFVGRGSQKRPFHVVRLLTMACLRAYITAPGFGPPLACRIKSLLFSSVV